MTKKILFLGFLAVGIANACSVADYLKKTAYYGSQGYILYSTCASVRYNYMDGFRQGENIAPNAKLLKDGLLYSGKILSKDRLLALGNGNKMQMVVFPMITSSILSQDHPISLEVSKRSQSMLKYSAWYTPEIESRNWSTDDTTTYRTALIRRVAEPIVFEVFKSGLEKASEAEIGKSIMHNIPEEYQSAALEHGTFILASAGARVIGVATQQAINKKNYGYVTETVSDAAKNFKQDTFVYVGGRVAEYCVIKPGIEKYVEPALKQYVSPTVEYYTGIKDSEQYIKNGLNFAATYFVYTNLKDAAKKL